MSPRVVLFYSSCRLAVVLRLSIRPTPSLFVLCTHRPEQTKALLFVELECVMWYLTFEL